MPSTATNRALERIDTLGAISDHPRYRVRTLLSPANRRAAETIQAWMEEAGLVVTHTLDGTLRGILPGSNPEAPALLLGSHYDTVIDAGAYDGPLGIVAALAAIESLAEDGISLPFPVHLLAFSDEEGVRFQTTYIGSLGVIEDLDEGRLAACDDSGKTLQAALATEGWDTEVGVVRYRAADVRGYLELHIEQGRVLEEMGLAASAVSTLVGQTRMKITLEGQVDHAGTTPMSMRRDALAGAAQCITAVEHIAREGDSAVATVGKIEVHPGAANAIPRRATFTVDLRHPDDAGRERLKNAILTAFQEIAATRDLALDCQTILSEDATHCDRQLTDKLLAAVERVTGKRTLLVSGAGHDGVMLAKVMPIAMIFLRCRAGLSHHPDEYASPEDVAAGVEILRDFLTNEAATLHA